MDYRDKLHKNTWFLTTPIGVAFLAAGLMLLLMLMVYVTGQDVLRIFMRSN